MELMSMQPPRHHVSSVGQTAPMCARATGPRPVPSRPILARVLLSALCASLVGLPAVGHAGGKRKNPWGQLAAPTAGAPSAIGGYSGGCIAGASPLPMDGPGYHVMHPSRNRYWGHPELVDFVQDLAVESQRCAGGVLMIGDLGQPRGGRATGGHASHQSGLDVDIWFWHPKGAADAPPSDRERETLRARSVLDGKRGEIRERWKRPVAAMLKAAGSDPRVSRIFVHPIIKRELCQTVDGDRGWLRQIRPWYGHDDHFHVRLHCPKDSPDCQAQAPTPAGDGCGDELDWWFDEKAQADRKKARKKYQKKVVTARRWPEACDALLTSP